MTTKRKVSIFLFRPGDEIAPYILFKRGGSVFSAYWIGKEMNVVVLSSKEDGVVVKEKTPAVSSNIRRLFSVEVAPVFKRWVEEEVKKMPTLELDTSNLPDYLKGDEHE